MVLVRIRLEAADGSVKYFKPLLPLPIDRSVQEVCTSVIGEKIGLQHQDWKNYSLFEISTQDAPAGRKFEPSDNFNSLKNGAWILVKAKDDSNKSNDDHANTNLRGKHLSDQKSAGKTNSPRGEPKSPRNVHSDNSHSGRRGSITEESHSHTGRRASITEESKPRVTFAADTKPPATSHSQPANTTHVQPSHQPQTTSHQPTAQTPRDNNTTTAPAPTASTPTVSVSAPTAQTAPATTVTAATTTPAQPTSQPTATTPTATAPQTATPAVKPVATETPTIVNKPTPVKTAAPEPQKPATAPAVTVQKPAVAPVNTETPVPSISIQGTESPTSTATVSAPVIATPTVQTPTETQKPLPVKTASQSQLTPHIKPITGSSRPNLPKYTYFHLPEKLRTRSPSAIEELSVLLSGQSSVKNRILRSGSAPTAKEAAAEKTLASFRTSKKGLSKDFIMEIINSTMHSAIEQSNKNTKHVIRDLMDDILDEVERRNYESDWEDWEEAKTNIELAVNEEQSYVREHVSDLERNYDLSVQLEEMSTNKSPYSTRILAMVEEFSCTVGMIDDLFNVIANMQQIEEPIYLVNELTNIEKSKQIINPGYNPVRISCTLQNIIKS